MDVSELESHSPGDYFYDVRDQLKRHIYERSMKAFAAGDRARDSLDSTAAVQARQEALRARFLDSIGGIPDSDSPLNAKIVGIIEEPDLRIEKVIFESRPRHY